MKETVVTYTKLFQELQTNLGTQEFDLLKMIRKLDEEIIRLDLALEDAKQYYRPSNLYLIILTKMRGALATYKSRCDIILKQVRSSKIDISETLTTHEWVSNAIATKEKLDANT